MEYYDNRSQLQREETIQKKRKKRSAKDDDELPHSKKLGSEDGFVFSTRRVTRSASKQQHQQQQHGEGKKQKKPFRWREMTDEELEAHKKKAEESEGFDVGEVPGDVFMNIILPCELDGPASALRPYNKMAKKALAAYKENVTKYKFVKHVRVNRKGGAVASSYYITFQAKDKKAGSQNFQTAVGSYRDLINVKFCRVEKNWKNPKALGRHHNCSGSMLV